MKQLVLVGILAGAVAAGVAYAEQRKPSPQPTTSGEVSVPAGDVALGAVRIPRRVKADGKDLAAGTYQVRVTAQEAKPDVVGQLEQLERWVEFSQRGQVRGREVVSIVPGSEIRQVAEDAPPRAGGVKVQMLKGNDYLRLWFNRAGNHYLIHLPPA